MAGRPRTKTVASREVTASPALEQLAHIRDTRLVQDMIAKWLRETEKEHAERFAVFDRKLDGLAEKIDALLSAAAPAPAEQVNQIAHQLSLLVRVYGALCDRNDEVIVGLMRLAMLRGEQDLAEQLEALVPSPPAQNAEQLEAAARAVGETPPEAIVLWRPRRAVA